MATVTVSQITMNSRDQIDVWVEGGRGNLKTLSTINIRVDDKGQVIITYTGDNIVTIQGDGYKG